MKILLPFVAVLGLIFVFSVFAVALDCPQTSCYNYISGGKFFSFKLSNFKAKQFFSCDKDLWGSSEVKGLIRVCCYQKYEFCKYGCKDGQCLPNPEVKNEELDSYLSMPEFSTIKVSGKKVELKLKAGANLVGGFKFDINTFKNNDCELLYFNGFSDTKNPFVYYTQGEFRKTNSVGRTLSTLGYWIPLKKDCTITVDLEVWGQINLKRTNENKNGEAQLISVPFDVTKAELEKAGCKFTRFNKYSTTDKPFVYWDTTTENGEFKSTDTLKADGRGYWIPLLKGCTLKAGIVYANEGDVNQPSK